MKRFFVFCIKSAVCLVVLACVFWGGALFGHFVSDDSKFYSYHSRSDLALHLFPLGLIR
jgi:hypothetical protein